MPDDPTNPRTREWLLLAAFSPLLLFIGLHVPLIAILLRKYLRIPFILSVCTILLGTSIPLIYLRGNLPVWVPIAIILISQFLAIVPYALRGELLDGGNLECVAASHMVLFCFLLCGFTANALLLRKSPPSASSAIIRVASAVSLKGAV